MFSLHLHCYQFSKSYKSKSGHTEIEMGAEKIARPPITTATNLHHTFDVLRYSSTLAANPAHSPDSAPACVFLFFGVACPSPPTLMIAFASSGAIARMMRARTTACSERSSTNDASVSSCLFTALHVTPSAAWLAVLWAGDV